MYWLVHPLQYIVSHKRRRITRRNRAVADVHLIRILINLNAVNGTGKLRNSKPP